MDRRAKTEGGRLTDACNNGQDLQALRSSERGDVPHARQNLTTPNRAPQIEFAFLHAKDEDGILAGLDMMSREEAVKALVGAPAPRLSREE